MLSRIRYGIKSKPKLFKYIKIYFNIFNINIQLFINMLMNQLIRVIILVNLTGVLYLYNK